MTNLSPEARALIEQGRSALRGTQADRARIEAALRARLGPEALPIAGGGSRWLGLARGHALTGAAIGACMLGGVAFWAFAPHARVPAARPPIATSPANPPLIIHEAPALESPAAPPPPTRASAPAPRDRLEEEAALLARATRELRAGHAAKALKALDEHARRFPRGVLIEERRSARAQALCASGHVSEGRAEQALLPEHSPAAARAKQACDVRSE